MTTIIVKTEADKADMIRVLKNRKPPFTISITKGVKRTIEQNKLQRKWLNEASEQGDQTAEEYRAYCKLHIGVPLLRQAADQAQEKLDAGGELTSLEQGYLYFKARYDEKVKPLPYETKLALMAEPFDFPITRLMSTALSKEYLDRMYVHFRSLGFVLTEPGQVPLEAYA